MLEHTVPFGQRAAPARGAWWVSDRLAALSRLATHPLPAVAITIVGYSFLGLLPAVLIVGVILSHELAHWVVMRRLGYKPEPVRMIPLLGAYVRAGRPMLRSADIAFVYLAGPLAGVLVAAIAAFLASNLDNPWLCHQVYIGATVSLALHLFNLIPAEPLDGGLIARALPFRAMLLFPFLVGIWLLAFGQLWTIPGILALVGAYAVACRATERWRRYLGSLHGRVLHGDLTALRERRASLDVPMQERVVIAVAYVLLATVTLLLLRALVMLGGFAWY